MAEIILKKFEKFVFLSFSRYYSILFRANTNLYKNKTNEQQNKGLKQIYKII